MIITCYRRVPVRADVDFASLGRFLARTGWELVQIGEWTDDGLDCYKIAKWKRGRETLTLRDNMDAERIAAVVTRLARLDDREDVEVLLDIAGGEIVDRGAAISRYNSAMARLRDAQDIFDWTHPHKAADYERARVALAQAEQDVEKATAALRAAEKASCQK